MTSMHRGAAACRVAVALAGMAMPVAVRAQTPPPGDDLLPKPSVPFAGWHLGTTLYAGWDSNALDVPDGPSDYDYELAGDVAWGHQGRYGAAGLSAEGGRRLYAEFDERDTWRGSGALTAGRQLSRSAVVSLAGGIRYDYTDNFLLVPEIGTQLPRTKALGAYGEGRVDLKLARRTLWSNEVRYDGVDFQEDDLAGESGLTDTRGLQVQSALSQRLARRDDLAATYEFLHAKWGPDTSDSHAVLLSWKHGFSETWSFEVESGVSRVVPPDPDDTEAQWLFAGGATLTAKTDRSSVSVSYRRSPSVGYGIGQILNSDVIQASASLPLGRRVEFGLTGAFDRSEDPFDPTYRNQGAYVDVRLTTRVFRRLGLVGSYRYRSRDYDADSKVKGHRVGLALTTAFESRRPTTDTERGRR